MTGEVPHRNTVFNWVSWNRTALESDIDILEKYYTGSVLQYIRKRKRNRKQKEKKTYTLGGCTALLRVLLLLCTSLVVVPMEHGRVRL